jgi:hypothetical protein
MAGEPPAPGRDRHHQRQRAQAQELHRQVGRDGAREAEQIAHRILGGMAQAWILHRPAGEREREQYRRHDEGDAKNLAQAAADHVAQRIGQEAQTIEALVDRRHRPARP